MQTAALKWSDELPRWAIPETILARAPVSPWIHPVSAFRPTGDLRVDTPSRLRALEALSGSDAPSVLGVGCGGGRAAFGLVPPAVHVVGVDHQAGMLEVFRETADSLGATCRTHLGDWPDVAADAEACDVVTCHHVFYNVADLVPFVTALTGHARRRVVVELPERHPLSGLSPLWRHFWHLERPDGPTAEDALAVVRETGVDARIARFTVHEPPVEITDQAVAHTRIRLCLGADRDDEVRAQMLAHRVTSRDLATIWWDTA